MACVKGERKFIATFSGKRRLKQPFALLVRKHLQLPQPTIGYCCSSESNGDGINRGDEEEDRRSGLKPEVN